MYVEFWMGSRNRKEKKEAKKKKKVKKKKIEKRKISIFYSKPGGSDREESAAM